MSAALKGTARKFLWDHSAFRCCYFLSLFLSSLCFVELGFQILTGVTMVWSVLILIDIFRRLYPRKNLKYFGLLCAFVACGLATALLHAEDNLVTNLVMMYHVAVCIRSGIRKRCAGKCCLWRKSWRSSLRYSPRRAS